MSERGSNAAHQHRQASRSCTTASGIPQETRATSSSRGLALALIKKLTLEGDEIWVRFFDSRLHETIKIIRSGQVPVPYLLSFRSERGRNYGKVFRQFDVKLD